jgi:adenosylmethionine-8-amino-7-oxononanoate aminotransferase
VRAEAALAAPAIDRAQLEAWDDAHLWHPFTPHSVYRQEEPLLIAAGDGHYLVDVDGRRYLDGVASLWCNAFGHRHPRIDAAVVAQLGQVAHATLLGHASVPAVRLARRLVELAPPGLSRVFFSDDGSTAVEVALKMALQHWQQRDGGREKHRRRFLALTDGYHGDTVGAVALGGIELFHARFAPLLFEVVRVPAGDLAALERAVERHGEELAAVVVEPGFQGAAGIVTYADGYLQRLAELTRNAGALLLFDEVATGMGRSGHVFASEAVGIVPDLLCVAKGLTGGYLPLAATLTTEAVFGAFLGPPEEGRTFFHGHTYTGNALGAAAALATLELLSEPGTLAAVRARAARLAVEVERLRRLPAVGAVRSWGLAAGIDLVAERAGNRPYPPGERRGMRVCRAARDRGVFLRPLGDTIVLMPPLSIGEDELVLLVEAVAHGISAACGDARR